MSILNTESVDGCDDLYGWPVLSAASAAGLLKSATLNTNSTVSDGPFFLAAPTLCS
jgi:hypothetical protein